MLCAWAYETYVCVCVCVCVCGVCVWQALSRLTGE